MKSWDYWKELYYFNSDFVRSEILDGQKYVEVVSHGRHYVFVFADETEAEFEEVYCVEKAGD